MARKRIDANLRKSSTNYSLEYRVQQEVIRVADERGVTASHLVNDALKKALKLNGI